MSTIRMVVALALALPVTLAGLMALGVLEHGKTAVFLVAGWLLSPLPMVAMALDLPDGPGLVAVLLQWILWAYVIERGIERLFRSQASI
jgi:hypothetical protein